MKALLIAEKPSLMRDIRSAYEKHKGAVGFAIDFLALHGHVLVLKEPRELNEKYKKWNLEDYPVTFDYVHAVRKDSIPIVRAVRDALKGNYDFIIHAGDPDQEGQLLVDELLLYLGNNKPVKRFWTNDTTEQGILDELLDLKPNEQYQGFYRSALMRAHLDYQFGMNLTVVGTVKYAPFKVVYKLGRVKAAILSIVTEREKQIRNFRPKTTYKKAFLYHGDEFVSNEEHEAKEFQIPDSAVIKAVSYTEKAIKAPKLFKLSSLQDECYKQFGWNGKRTLMELQQLYEAHMVSYPRTDCEYLSTNTDLVRILGRDYPKTDKDYFNDKAIATEGHTAIIPTGVHASLAGDSKKLYELIDRRFRAIFAPVKRTKTVKVTASAEGEEYKWSHTWNLQDGYETVLCLEYQPPILYDERYIKDMELKPIQGFAKECTTKPPARFNDGSIIKTLDFKDEIDGKGIEFSIGTSATRADIVEDCIHTGYFERRKGVLHPTEMAFSVMEAMGSLPVFNYKLTAEWERNFRVLQQGEDGVPEEHYLNILHGMINHIKADTRGRSQFSGGGIKETKLVCPKCGKPLVAKTTSTKKKIFTHAIYPNDCGFTFWREFMGCTFTEKEAAALMDGKSISKQLVSKKGASWTQELKWDGSGFQFLK